MSELEKIEKVLYQNQHVLHYPDEYKNVAKKIYRLFTKVESERDILLAGNILKMNDSFRAYVKRLEAKLRTFKDSVNELPQTFGAEIYSGLFILSNKINNDIIEYVKKLRLLKCNQVVFILGSISSKEVFSKILEIENCFLYEKSTYALEQFIQLFNQLQDLSDQFFIKAHGNDLLWAFSAFNILIKNFIQYVILRKFICIFLSGP